MTADTIKTCQAIRPVISRYEQLRKIKAGERTLIEEAEYSVFCFTRTAKKALDESEVALRLLQNKIAKVKDDCKKLYPKISDLKEEIDSQITKGLGTIKLSRRLDELENERNNKESWIDRQVPALEEARSLITLRTKEYEDKVREAQFRRKCLGAYRQAFADAYEQMYLAIIESMKAVHAIGKNFTPISDNDIGEIVNGADWLNENHERLKEVSDIFYGKDHPFGIWDKIVDIVIEDEHRARTLNEKDFPLEGRKLPPQPTGKEKPMFGLSRTMILRDSQNNYPDSELNAEKILTKRKEQATSRGLADFED